MSYKVILDAGHGGYDYGATYNGRNEKDDNLRLALAVGNLLEPCMDVAYTRTTDVYNTPFEKAMMGNNSGADYFVSIHRNAYLTPNTTKGIETLVFHNQGIKSEMADNINEELEKVGFVNRGIVERPNLVVLKRTKIPALLVEAGFIDSDDDNGLFDEKFDEIAQAIANGITKTLGVNCNYTSDIRSSQTETNSHRESRENADYQRSVTGNRAFYGMGNEYEDDDMDDRENNDNYARLYRVQVGAYGRREYAQELLTELKKEGYPAYIVYEDGLYKVFSGAYALLDNAVRMEDKLRKSGYNTFIIL